MKPWSVLGLFVLCIFLTRSANACSDDCMPYEHAIPSIISGEITHISGGIGVCEASAMRTLIKDYPLSLLFIQKLEEREEFIADVRVELQDRYQHVLLDIVTEGPYMLMNLPNGKYHITAEFNGVMNQRWVNVSSDKAQQVVFWWPIQDSPE